MRLVPYFDSWWETHANGIVVDSNYTTLALLDDEDFLLSNEEAFNIASANILNCNQSRMWYKTFSEMCESFFNSKGGYLSVQRQAIQNLCGGLEWVTGEIVIFERDAYGKIKVSSWTDSDGDAAHTVHSDTKTVNIGVKCSKFGEVILNSSKGLDNSPIEFWAEQAYNLDSISIQNEMENILFNTK